MNRWTGAFVASLLAGCCFAPRPAPSAPATTTPLPTIAAACEGHWTGTGMQAGYPPWPIDMNVVPAVADRCGTIEYPSLGCGGYLTGCAALADGEASFTEVYEHTSTNCSPAGSIHATCTGTTMVWTWEGQGGPLSTTLTRM